MNKFAQSRGAAHDSLHVLGRDAVKVQVQLGGPLRRGKCDRSSLRWPEHPCSSWATGSAAGTRPRRSRYATSATLAIATGIQTGQVLLIDTAGNAEVALVVAVAGAVVTFSQGLVGRAQQRCRSSGGGHPGGTRRGCGGRAQPVPGRGLIR